MPLNVSTEHSETKVKVLNITWDDDSNQEGNETELETSSPNHGKFMASMAKSNVFSMQDISDKDSKSKMILQKTLTIC